MHDKLIHMGCEPCRNGWTDRDAIWVDDWWAEGTMY